MLFASLRHATPVFHHPDTEVECEDKSCTALYFDQVRKTSSLSRREPIN